jgi:signal transduction histidine kinase
LVHSIVHDLAVPLHAILGALSLLRELPLSEQAAQWTQVALDAATRQRQLIADILDTFAAEYKALTALPDPFAAVDLAAVIREVVAQVLPAASSRGMSMRSDVGEGPWRVMADQGRLVRVLANLVHNGLRHSPPGGTVTVSAEREDASIRASVDDEGPGVPQDLIPHLFERFGGKLGRVAGTGLGLYFCRITVEQWGGGIGYERRPGGGSRFWVRLVDALTRKRHG